MFYLSIFFSLFFLGCGFWFFYHIVIKRIPEYIKAKQLVKRILRPNLKTLNAEITGYSDLLRSNSDIRASKILDKLVYIKIIQKDIISTLSLIKKTRDADKRNILLRTICLTLYEFYNDIGTLYDKKFQNDVIKNLQPEMVDGLKGIKKMTAQIRTQHFNRLQDIRMNVIGHRDFDIVKQVDLMNEINIDEVVEMSNSALFTIYFFNLFHTALAAQLLRKAKQKLPNVPMFQDLVKDVEVWGIYIKSKNLV